MNRDGKKREKHIQLSHPFLNSLQQRMNGERKNDETSPICPAKRE
jgi:hypothetical protein